MMPKSVFAFFVVLSVAYVNCKPQRIGFGHGEVIEEEEYVREFDGPFGEETEIDFIERDKYYKRSNPQYQKTRILRRSTPTRFEKDEVVEDYNSEHNEQDYGGYRSSAVQPDTYAPEGHYEGDHSGSLEQFTHTPGETENDHQSFAGGIQEKIENIYNEATNRVYNLLKGEYQAVKDHGNYINGAVHNAIQRVLTLLRGEQEYGEYEHELGEHEQEHGELY